MPRTIEPSAAQVPPPCHPRPSLLRTPGIQLCVTKPVLLESECSMRQGHMGFLPTSSPPSSPSRECTRQPPAKRQRGQDNGIINSLTRCSHEARDGLSIVHFIVVVVDTKEPLQNARVILTCADTITRSDCGLPHGSCIKIEVASGRTFDSGASSPLHEASCGFNINLGARRSYTMDSNSS